MTEKELYTLIIYVLETGLAALPAPWPTVDVRQLYQPTIVGTPSGPFLGLSNQPLRRYGFLKRTDRYNGDDLDPKTIHTETQKWVCIFQVNAQWKQDPEADDFATVPTAGDLARRASSILQSDAGREILALGGVGIERITDVREPPFTDDSDEFEYSPSFDFTINFDQSDVTEIPILSRFRSGIYPV